MKINLKLRKIKIIIVERHQLGEGCTILFFWRIPQRTVRELLLTQVLHKCFTLEKNCTMKQKCSYIYNPTMTRDGSMSILEVTRKSQ